MVTWKIPYFRHDLGKPEVDRLAKVLEGDILTTGAEVAEFEQRFAAYLGQRHAFALTSCTGALHLALLALDIGPGGEVITTPCDVCDVCDPRWESDEEAVITRPLPSNIAAAILDAAE